MTRDYYPALKRAAAALGSQAQAPRAVYDRARSFIAAAGLSARRAGEERAALESAIERIEAEREWAAAARAPLHRSLESVRPLRDRWPLAAASVVLLVAGLATWALWPNEVTKPGASTTRAAAVPAVPAEPASRPEAAPRSYVFNRQMVYYRTVHPVGTVLIAKAQRLLYVVVSNVSAIRYTVGVGRECANVAGLLLVSAKEEWAQGPVEQATDRRRPGARFGARSLALGDTGYRIHGTNARATPSDDGCFPLVNDDIIHLYDRVPVGTRVVIN